MSAIHFEAGIGTQKIQSDINKINSYIGNMSKNIQKEGAEIDRLAERIGRAFVGIFSVYQAAGFIKSIAQVMGEFQQLEVSFETMLGSKQKADAMMSEAVSFAIKTPFTLTEVASGAKQLLAYGIEAEKLIPTLKAVGDISAGLSVPIERLILNYGQVRTQTKLTGRELRDFQMAGVPIVAELAKNLNVSEQAISDMVSTGKIGFAEVEDAFISMTSEGGKFSDLMEKQALTITGLTSNLSDAWTRMLNSIGKENEGIIAGSIRGATTLVENYEEIIKILKVLIATYGAYKAAVIATTVAQRASVAAGNIQAWFQLASGIKTAKDAQIAFNLATKANPIGLIMGAISALVTTLVVFGKTTKKTQDYIDDLNKSIESIGRQIEVDKLVDKYVELSDKTKKTKAEQTELNKTIQELAGLFPGTISEVDRYGKAIDLAKDKLILLNDELRENAKIVTEKNITDNQDELNKKIELRAKLIEEINRGYIETEIATGEAGLTFIKQTELKEKGIEARRNQVEKLNDEIQKLNQSVLEGEAKLRDFGQIDASKALEDYRHLFGTVTEYSSEQAQKISDELVNLLFQPFPPEAERRIKDEIDKIADHMALPTIQEQIKLTFQELERAQKTLAQMRMPGARTTPEAISDKEGEIKQLQEMYDVLTGIDRKGLEKRQDEQRKAEIERLKALADFHREEITLERQLQASKIAVMKEGEERRMAEAELNFQIELDRIDQQQRAYLEAWNASKGFKPDDFGFIDDLPESELERFTQLRVNAEKKKNIEIKKINKETANEIKAIWKEVNDVFLSDNEKQVQSIDEKYQVLLEKANAIGNLNTNDIYIAWFKEIEEANIDSAMRRLQFEEEIEMQRAEISTQGFNRDIEIERKKLEIVKKVAKQKIEVLKKSSTEESRQEIAQLELYIQAADAGLEELNQKTLTQSIEKITQMVDEFKRFSDEIFGVDSQMSRVLVGLGEMGNSFAKITTGDYSGAISLLTSLMKIGLDSTRVENRLAKPWEEFERWIAASNRELQRYISLRDEAIGTDKYIESDKVIEQLQDKIEETENRLAGMQLKFTLEGQGWFNKANREVADKLDKLQKQLGGFFTEESYKEVGVAFWEKVKAIYSYDLDQLLFDEKGEFTIQKINQLIDDMVITDRNVIEAVNQYEQLLTQLSQAERQKQELLTATMADNIADGIIEGFRKGYDSVTDFADGFEELMKNAVLNALKIQMLEEPLREWYAQFAAYSESDDILTSGEIRDLENAYNNIIESARKRFEEMKRISGLNFDTGAIKQEGLAGAIKGITEETAGIIAGQFMAMRELGQKSYTTGLEQLAGINQSVTHLARIEENTRHNRKLNDIDEKIGEMNLYLRQVV